MKGRSSPGQCLGTTSHFSNSFLPCAHCLSQAPTFLVSGRELPSPLQSTVRLSMVHHPAQMLRKTMLEIYEVPPLLGHRGWASEAPLFLWFCRGLTGMVLGWVSHTGTKLKRRKATCSPGAFLRLHINSPAPPNIHASCSRIYKWTD